MYDFYAYSKNAISNFERLKKGFWRIQHMEVSKELVDQLY